MEAHREVLTKNGSVWFGIKGRSLSTERRSILARQLEDSHPTYLYCAQLLPRGVEVFRGSVTAITEQIPPLELNLLPSYYAKQGILAQMKFWAKIGAIESVKSSELRLLKLSSTGSPVIRLLGRNMCSLLSVTQPSRLTKI
jgi:hypothetical protein